MQEDEEILCAGELPTLTEPARYFIVCDGISETTRFARSILEFEFFVISDCAAYGARLPGYCPTIQTGRAPVGSKLVRWIRLIADFTGLAPSKISRRMFREFWFEGEVETVMTNYRGILLHQRDRYSVVRELIAVKGKRSELPTSG